MTLLEEARRRVRTYAVAYAQLVNTRAFGMIARPPRERPKLMEVEPESVGIADRTMSAFAQFD